MQIMCWVLKRLSNQNFEAYIYAVFQTAKSGT